jgi:hypothetical protein
MTWREWIVGWTARYWQLRTAKFLREEFREDAGYCLDRCCLMERKSQ